MLAHSRIQEASVVVPSQGRERSVRSDSGSGRHKVIVLEGDELAAITRERHQFVVVGQFHTTEQRVEREVETIGTHITQHHKVRVQCAVGKLADLEESASLATTNGEYLTSDGLHSNGTNRISHGKIGDHLVVRVGSHHQVGAILVGQTQVETRVPVGRLTTSQALANTVAVKSNARVKNARELLVDATIRSAHVVESTKIGVLAHHSRGDADTILATVSGTRIIVLALTLRVGSKAASSDPVAHRHLAAVGALSTHGGRASGTFALDTNRGSSTGVIVLTRSVIGHIDFNATTDRVAHRLGTLVLCAAAGHVSNRTAHTVSIALRLSNARQVKLARVEVGLTDADTITAEVVGTLVLVITVQILTDTTLRRAAIDGTRIVVTADSGRIVGVVALTSASVTGIGGTRVVIITVVSVRHHAALIDTDISAA